MRRPRCQCGAHPFSNVHERIDEHRVLHYRHRAQSLPRIVSAPEKDHRRDDHTEHETDLLRRDRGAEKKPERRESGGTEYRDEQYDAYIREAKKLDWSHDHARDRQHEYRRNHSLDHAGEDLLRGNEPDRNGGEEAVFDLTCPSEVLHHRQDRKSTRLNSSHGYISYAV